MASVKLRGFFEVARRRGWGVRPLRLLAEAAEVLEHFFAEDVAGGGGGSEGEDEHLARVYAGGAGGDPEGGEATGDPLAGGDDPVVAPAAGVDAVLLLGPQIALVEDGGGEGAEGIGEKRREDFADAVGHEQQINRHRHRP